METGLDPRAHQEAVRMHHHAWFLDPTKAEPPLCQSLPLGNKVAELSQEVPDIVFP